MNRHPSLLVSLVSSIGMAALLLGCEVGGVGDPCIPEDEYTNNFSGFSVEEVNVESRSFQCVTRICLVNHFQGRVSCPYGNKASDENIDNDETPPECYIPDNYTQEDQVVVPVDPQLAKRKASDAVYCSCRCDGPDKNASYCDCPSGFACQPLVDEFKLGRAQLVGSYCIREGSEYEKSAVPDTNLCRYSSTQTQSENTGTPTENGFCGKVDEHGAPL